MDSINYYNKNSAEFIEGTFNADMSKLRETFLQYIPEKGRVLDLGCGSGRDAKAFMELGYETYAMDGSEEMVKYCKQFLGDRVKLATFQEYETDMMFDGIWASASLLHVDEDEIEGIIRKYFNLLVDNGAFYMSFKYRDENFVKGERYFNCFTEDKVKELCEKIPGASVVERFATGDVRDGRDGEMWISVVVQKYKDSYE